MGLQRVGHDCTINTFTARQDTHTGVSQQEGRKVGSVGDHVILEIDPSLVKLQMRPLSCDLVRVPVSDAMCYTSSTMAF